MAYPPQIMPMGNHVPEVRNVSEKKLGILHYSSPVDFGWRGDLRKRYTDFLVNEVRKDGTVLHLTDVKMGPEPKKEFNGTKLHPSGQFKQPQFKQPATSAPEEPELKPVSDDDVQILTKLLGSAPTEALLDAYNAIANKTAARGLCITLKVETDRAARTMIHEEIRRIFNSRFETSVEQRTNMVTAAIAKPGAGRRGNRNWGDQKDGVGGRGSKRADKRGKRYLHFTMYKENRDTMESINHIARMLKIKSSNFGFAGTKDRRAATTQRVSMLWNQDMNSVYFLNTKSTNLKLGDFTYQSAPIQLGQHGGNEFVITIKNTVLTRGAQCSIQHRLEMTAQCVQSALDHVLNHGFINYFGLQRFGTHTIGTQEIGQMILSGDFKGALDCILHVDKPLRNARYTPDREVESTHQRDDILRGQAITIWKETGNVPEALKVLPKRFSAEATILRHLGRSNESGRDYCGALLAITRGLRNLYLHAYQAYVWNFAASERWAKYGDRVIVGDLVLVETEAAAHLGKEATDMSEDPNLEEEEFFQRARPLTAEDVASGKHTIFDVVLPTPGFDIQYPDNGIGDFIVAFMAKRENGRLDAYSMHRTQREFSLSGSYRKLMTRFSTTPKFVVLPYKDDAQQMHPTDLDEIKAAKTAEQKMRAARAKSENRSFTANPATVAAWQHFAENTESFDDAERESRRRARELERASEPRDLRVNEKWIETAVDGTNKRVKVGQHKSLLTPESPVESKANGTNGTDGASFGLQSASSSSDPFDPNGQASQPLYSIPSLDGAAESKPPKQEELDIAPIQDLPGFSPPKGDLGFSSLAGSLAAVPATRASIDLGLSKDAPGFRPRSAGATGIRSSIEEPAVSFKARPSSGSGGYPMSARAESKMPTSLPVNLFKSADAEDGKAVNLTPAEHRQAGANNSKIAVILNFRLTSSSYATICLRELMGTCHTDMFPDPTLTHSRMAAAVQRASREPSAH